ncbi:RHS repeat-associated core domain-containing protein [Lacrimispora brassicae]
MITVSYNPNLESQYLRARYYDTTLGSFYSEDRYLGNVLDPLSLNRYNYVKSSPLNYTDPTGHFSQKDVNKVITDHFVNVYNSSKEATKQAWNEALADVKQLGKEALTTLDRVFDAKMESGMGFGGSVTVGNISAKAEYKIIKEYYESLTPVDKEVFYVGLMYANTYKMGIEASSNNPSYAPFNLRDLELKLGLDKYEASVDVDEDIKFKLIGLDSYMSIGGGISLDLNVSELLRLMDMLSERRNACSGK